MIAKANLVGRLVKDAELKQVTGTCLAQFTLACNKKKTGEGDNVSFFDCVVWGKYAQALLQYLRKGTMVYLDGTLEQKRWQGKDGKSREKVIINVIDLKLLQGEKKQEESQAGEDDDEVPF